MPNTKKIKILFNEPVSDMGGVSYYILNIILFLPKEEYSIHFVADGDGKMFDLMNKNNVIIHKLPTDYNSLFDLLKKARVHRKLIIDNNFDIIHCHTAKSGLLYWVASIGLNKILIYTGHGWRHLQLNIFLKKITMFFLEFLISKRFDFLTFLNQKEYKYGLKYNLNKKNNSSVVPISLDLDSFLFEEFNQKNKEYFKLPEDSLLISMFGRITHQKDPDTFVKIVKDVCSRIDNVYFIWVGDGDLKDFILKKSKELNISERIIITGFLDQIEAKKIISGSDIMLFTSIFEGLPISIIEAMSLNVPVVSSDVGGISDIVIDKKTGRLYKKGDYLEASNILCELIKDKKEASVYALNAFENIKNNYSPRQKMSEIFNKLYKFLIHENNIRKNQ